MSTASKLHVVLIVGLFSYTTGAVSTKDQNTTSSDALQQVQADFSKSIPDTIRRFIVDDYPVTDEMIDDRTSHSSSYAKQSGDVHSFDKAWFTNKELKQTLVFEMYTDYHRLVTFHFYNDDIPKALIDRMELHTGDGNLASLSQKLKNFRGFVNSAPSIDRKYFTSDKGVKLGDKKQTVLGIYGAPNKTSKDDKLEVLEWDFVGDIFYDSKKDLKVKTVATDSFGHQARMFFRNNKLIAIILHNDIP